MCGKCIVQFFFNYTYVFKTLSIESGLLIKYSTVSLIWTALKKCLTLGVTVFYFVHSLKVSLSGFWQCKAKQACILSKSFHINCECLLLIYYWLYKVLNLHFKFIDQDVETVSFKLISNLKYCMSKICTCVSFLNMIHIFFEAQYRPYWLWILWS